MALSYVGQAQASANTVSLPAFAAGDIAVVFAWRNFQNTPPTLPAGWTDIDSYGDNSHSSRLGFRVLQSGDTTIGTWTNAARVYVVVYRGQHAADPIGGFARFHPAANGDVMQYNEVILQDAGGGSAIIGFASHRTATDVNTRSVTGMTNRSGSITGLALHTVEGVSSFVQHNWDSVVNTSSGRVTWALELVAAAAAGGYTLTADPGSVTITGTAASLKRGLRIGADAGNVAITGTAASLIKTNRLSAEAGAYTIGGIDANLLSHKKVVAESGSSTITGTAASLEYNRAVIADAGSVDVTGTSAVLEYDRRISAESGNVQITGQNAGLIYGTGYVLNAETGIVQVPGQSASLEYARLLSPEPGIVSITGIAAFLGKNSIIQIESGAYTVSGTAAALEFGRAIVAGSGNVQISGQDATFKRSLILSPDIGVLNVTGTSAALTYSAIAAESLFRTNFHIRMLYKKRMAHFGGG